MLLESSDPLFAGLRKGVQVALARVAGELPREHRSLLESSRARPERPLDRLALRPVHALAREGVADPAAEPEQLALTRLAEHAVAVGATEGRGQSGLRVVFGRQERGRMRSLSRDTSRAPIAIAS